MSLNTTPTTFTAGEVVTAAKLNTEVRDAHVGLQAAWTSYTPTLVGFTLGNGTMTAKYHRVGKTIEYRVVIVFGSTSTWTSVFGISLPVTPHADYVVHAAIGRAAFYDTSVGAASREGGVAMSNGVDTLILATSPGPVSNTVPFTWANGDHLSVSGSYEAA